MLRELLRIFLILLLLYLFILFMIFWLSFSKWWGGVLHGVLTNMNLGVDINEFCEVMIFITAAFPSVLIIGWLSITQVFNKN